jgi:MFS family permease
VGNRQVRAMMLSVLAINVTASSYVVLLPVFAKDVFAGGATTLGWLWGAAGLGSLLSTLFLASRLTVASLPRTILVASCATGLALLTFAWSDLLVLSLAAMAVIGAGITVSNVGTNIVLQSTAPDAMRGRVVALYTSIRFGFDAIGGLLAGLLAARLGAPPVLAAAGAILLGYCIWLGQRTCSSAAPDKSSAASADS